MRPVINERYETMFRWLAKRDLEKYSNVSNKFLYELYMKANNLKETVNNFRKLLKDLAEMIRNKNMVLRAMDNTICKFRSENGEVVFQGNEIRQPKNRPADPNRNKRAKKRAAPEEHSSHYSSLENQEPRAKTTNLHQPVPAVRPSSS